MTDILLVVIIALLWAILRKLWEIYELLNSFDKPFLYEPDEKDWLDKPNKKGKK